MYFMYSSGVCGNWVYFKYTDNNPSHLDTELNIAFPVLMIFNVLLPNYMQSHGGGTQH